MGLFDKKHRHHHHHSHHHHHHHHHDHGERIEISTIDEAAKDWVRESDIQIEKTSNDSGEADSEVKSPEITGKTYEPVEAEPSEHHHHHHRKHRRHKKKKSLFRINREQKHYRQHRSQKNEKISAQIILVIFFIIAGAGMLVLLVRLSDQRKNQMALQNLQEQQNELVNDQALEEEISIRYDQVVQTYNAYLPGFVCWGESLTKGSGGNGVTYPEVLEEIINTNLPVFEADKIAEKNGGQIIGGNYYKLEPVKVINMGASDENTATTLGRNGAIPFILASDITIPADTSPIEISLTNESGATVMPMRNKSAGMEYVVIGGVTGKIENNFETTEDGKVDHFLFTRSQAGGEIAVSAGTEVITSASLDYRNLIPIIMIGQNENYDDVENLIQEQKAIINHQQLNDNIKERYLIIGLPFLSEEQQDKFETALSQEYGLQFINVREYLATQGLAEAGIAATEEDKALILEGKIPASLKSDEYHLNEYGYEVVGKLIYQRMVMLGYFGEVEEAVNEVMN